MKVILNNKIYVMSRKKCREFLKVPEKIVKCGIYAIEQGLITEMKNEVFSSNEELMENVAAYAEKGYKVYYNN